MQRKQAFTTTQPAQCLGITRKIESEASELIAELKQIYWSQLWGKTRSSGIELIDWRLSESKKSIC